MASESLDPQFDAFADDYDAALQRGISVSGEDKNFFARGRLRHLAAVLQRLPLAAQSIMDFGCGTGSSTPFIFEFFPEARLIGTDVSAKSLDVARRSQGSPRAAFRRMDEHHPDATLDLVFCNGVFHHIPLPERSACMKFIFDTLRPGGLFAMFENNPWNPGTRLVMSRIPFDADAITLSPPAARRLFRESGFRPLRTDSLFYFPRMLKLLRPLEGGLRKLPLGAQYMVLGQKPG